ncbi:trypsin-like peptidase domain-containing protein [Aneurinibacillus sp. Ricciae_BoGa-3]|uniref:S1C family serine protease n=1 Tax=Aneurinibacillus sp. Ricciae_BoGa-3 TaxID=3022697 RepID=UPI00234203A1|nr:trypsin-like peptidase domain-containing protein [Aneurinibacillus sp. Ricciae_BoGa-3]WCK56400.1 trypsin-like peptidase domain-containing protein [Aneurinibacillus sp. Ricciae_BoGa-3]
MKPVMHKVLSIASSFIILSAGGFAFYYTNLHVTNPAVEAKSTLGQPPKATSNKNALDLKQIINLNQKKVVSIQVEMPDGVGQGSGFIYNNIGDVITNAHVVANASTIRVKTSDTSVYSGKVIGMSTDKDVALIRISALAGKEPMMISNTKNTELGDPVIAFGSPHGLDNTVTTGIISGLNRDFTIGDTKYTNVYQISAPIAPGNSGGPLVSQSTGEVIGINSAGGNDGNIGFSIPLSQVISMIQGWSDHPDDQLSAKSTSTSDQQLSDTYTADSLSQDATYLIQYFYENLNSGDYVTAYSLLGSDWRNKQSYETFRQGYIETKNVTLNHVSVLSSTPSSAEIEGIIEAQESNGTDGKLSSYKLLYTVAMENGKLKIIKGTATKL